jgi:hypothetical protein
MRPSAEHVLAAPVMGYLNAVTCEGIDGVSAQCQPNVAEAASGYFSAVALLGLSTA